MAAAAKAEGAHKVTVAVQPLPGFELPQLLEKSGYAAMLKETGLKAISSHEGIPATIEGMFESIAFHKAIGCEFRLGEDPVALLSEADGLVISPGVPITAPVVTAVTALAVADLLTVRYGTDVLKNGLRK